LASALETEVLPARLDGFRASDLDVLCAAGEVVWRGLEPVGASDGRVALYLTDQLSLLAPPPSKAEGELAERIRVELGRRGALFFADLLRLTSAFPQDLLHALWSLVWAGEATNDTFQPLRALVRASSAKKAAPASRRHAAFRSRRLGPPGSEGRWSLFPARDPTGVTETERRTALAMSLLRRHGVLTREAVSAEGLTGGFASLYPVLRAMEDAGRVRRGYFVQGLGALQFAAPGADEQLRLTRSPGADPPEPVVLAATDPANAHGAALPWPPRPGDTRPQRAAGALVIFDQGRLLAWVGKGERSLLTFLPPEEPARSEAARTIATALASLVKKERRRVVLIEEVDGAAAEKSELAPHLVRAGFSPGAKGYLIRAPALAGK
jgi:ATP-dependent Lhr-like helicase